MEMGRLCPASDAEYYIKCNFANPLAGSLEVLLDISNSIFLKSHILHILERNKNFPPQPADPSSRGYGTDALQE